MNHNGRIELAYNLVDAAVHAGTGINPMDWDKVIGEKALNDIPAETHVHLKDIAKFQ